MSIPEVLEGVPPGPPYRVPTPPKHLRHLRHLEKKTILSGRVGKHNRILMPHSQSMTAGSNSGCLLAGLFICAAAVVTFRHALGLVGVTE